MSEKCATLVAQDLKQKEDVKAQLDKIKFARSTISDAIIKVGKLLDFTPLNREC